MSEQAGNAAVAQPDQPAPSPDQGAAGVESQGASAPEGLYGEVLQAIPEHLRDAVEPHLKQWSGTVNQKFREAADYRKQWEPYEELGLTDVPPEQLQELLGLHQLAQDPDKFGEWLLKEAEARELLDPDGDDEFDFGDEDGLDGPQGFDQEGLKSMFSELLDERLKPIEERFSKSDEEERIAEANKQVDATLKELADEHGEFNQEAVMKLSLAHAKEGIIGPEAIKAGFADFQSIAGTAEAGMFKQKSEQPETPERGGRPATAQQPITDFKEATKQALAQVRHANAT